MVAPSMAAFLGPTQGRIFHDITEATDEMVRRTVTKFVTHAWKSLASTSGANFENFSVAVMNPYLPLDLNNMSIKLGAGVNPSLPISKKNKPDAITQAFMLTGGDFYTVNMIIPPEIVERWPYGKGEFEAQADYMRVIPPEKPKEPFQVKIVEFKNGLTQLEMADEEEAQMMKETETIEKWYDALGKKVVIERFYCPAVATNAKSYGSTHISTYTNFITIAGLAKIIQVPLDKMRDFTRYRVEYTKALTEKMNAIQERTLHFLETADASTVLAQLRQLTPQQLGLNVNTTGNLAAGRNYPGRRLSVVKYMIIRSTLLRKLKAANIRVDEKKQLERKLQHVTQILLETDKPAPVSETVLTPNARKYLKETLRGKAITNLTLQEGTFQDLLIERKEYLEETYPTLPVWPTNFTESELIRPITFTKEEQVIDERLTKLARKKAITNADIVAVVQTTLNPRLKLSNHFRLYFKSKIQKFKNLANEGKVKAPKNARPVISQVVYGSNSNNNEGVVNRSPNAATINSIIRRVNQNLISFNGNAIRVFQGLVENHTNANIRRALNKRIANSGKNNGIKDAFNNWRTV